MYCWREGWRLYLPPMDDLRDLEDVGLAKERSGLISRTADRRLFPSPARRVAGIARVGVFKTWSIDCEAIEAESSSSTEARALLAQLNSETRGFATGLCSLSENSDESSSWQLIIASQGLQTRILPGCPNRVPGIRSVHFESKICPHVRQ